MLPPSPLQPNGPHGRPTIVTGVEPTILGSLANAFLRAHDHQFYAIDVDLRGTWLPATLPESANADVVRIRSAWVPGRIEGWLADRRRARLSAFLNQAASSMGLRTIVVTRSSDRRNGNLHIAALRNDLSADARSSVRFALGVQGARVSSGHDQLAELTALRHMAEEWDLDLALDLSGDVPHYLEAEAAVLRLLPRLTLVRIPTWVTRTGELNT
ncbi:MAG TPA: hypothetical protein VD767_05865, partial [Thermomicrobiales bacterium]|nr:hypothetical protein [Thermomicrobiales bacterium]